MRINNNLMALNTHRQMGSTSLAQSKSMEKLSSGLRINRAGDDAAGLAISEKMRGEIRALNQQARNDQDKISQIQTAEGALNEVSAMLVRIKELHTQSAADTYNTDDKANITAEITALSDEIKSIKTGTTFNGSTILNDEITKLYAADPLAPTAGELAAGIDVGDLAKTETAIKNISKVRADYGAQQNTLEHRINNTNTASENLQAAESRIRDVDMAKEMMTLTKSNILQQASQSMLAQANQAPQSVLKLLQ